MASVPFDLPLKLAETASLAELIFQHAEGRPLTDDLRNRLAGRAVHARLETVAPYFGSLQRDPVHPSAYYLAIDSAGGLPLLLHVAPAAAPAGMFPEPVLIGRTRLPSGGEVLINCLPFSTRDHDAIARFAGMERALQPRPQGALPAVAAGNRHPEISLPAVFEAFRQIFKQTGRNLASTAQLSATREMTTEAALAARDGEDPTAPGHTRVSIRHLYHAGLWAAIRAGWREGYSTEADHFIISGDTPGQVARSVETAKEAVRHAAGFTKFTTDTSRLFVLEADPRHPRPWSDAAVAEKFESLLPAEERAWVLAEFARDWRIGDAVYTLDRADAMRLAVKFGASLKLNEELYDFIRQTRGARAFDFEPSLDEAETLTTPRELIFYMHWLKARGRPAQLVPPNLGFKKRQAYPETAEGLRAYASHKMWPELAGFQGRPLEELARRVGELAAVARHFHGTLSIHSGSGKQAEVLEAIGRATFGRVNYKISGELQLQLFDVLSEQPAGSSWRALYDRMVARSEEFAARGAFGSESELAAYYRRLGRGSYLGDASRGRTDGNLFLVFWLGNLVGTRDIAGDGRFFKQSLDELPADLLAEVRRRNTQYILWLARHLFG